MGKGTLLLLPKNQRLLALLGENIRMARLRRKLSAELLAERAQISRYTVGQIEKGKPSVTMGAYLQVLFVLGLEKDMEQVAAQDPLGRKLQDIGLTVKERAPKRKVKTISHGKAE